MKIGLLGGSFDPIHYGHMNMALAAKGEYSLDEVWLIPAGHSPHKKEEDMMSAEHRVAMCRMAASHYDGIRVNTIEVSSDETSYTYRTLQKLCQQHPDHDFYFIMGADSINYFDHWRHPEIISSLAKILVVNRGEFTEKALSEKFAQIVALFPADIRMVHCDKVHVSSSMIRSRISSNTALDGLLWDDVITYIRQNQLYC
ncbi:MAG: nicotinate (nicotinamide) nucleotide adenylyltransferase [Lachnospiraceae bacterium]|nr:nicotinate (nicotinamide) nucleotide adenylyltransferase [Lachnospiraceae bacterium]MDD6504981.1 nicotinate (nicotinamide) nucleotide adenylyltransferase [Lachnospiraceae bacterium]